MPSWLGETRRLPPYCPYVNFNSNFLSYETRRFPHRIPAYYLRLNLVLACDVYPMTFLRYRVGVQVSRSTRSYLTYGGRGMNRPLMGAVGILFAGIGRLGVR